MRVLFITKDFIIEPLGIMYLSAALKSAGHETEIIKADVENVEEKMKNFAPDIVTYSIITGAHKYFRDLNAELKKKFNFISVFGGPHATFFNEFIQGEGVDIICIGEGEGAIVDLANRLRDSKDFTDIPNLWVKRGEQVFKNPVRPLADINSLVFPDRELIYGKYPKSYHNPIKGFTGSRGCPYDCTFCYNHRLKEMYQQQHGGVYLRVRSVDNLLQEIKQVKEKYPMKMAYFQDDNLGILPRWLEEFSVKYKKMINLPFHCNERADTITEKFANLLKEAGCSGVSMAIETANDDLRNKILKKHTSREQIINAARRIKSAGLHLRTYNILGIPQGSLKDDFETLKLNILCKVDMAWSTIYQPYPRTELGDQVIKMGLYDGDFDKILETSYFGESPLNIPNRDKINNLQKLFTLTASFPFLLPLTKILINLPPNALFRKVYIFWKLRLNKKVYI